MASTDYHFEKVSNEQFNAYLVVDGECCQSRMGTLTRSNGYWTAEWVDGSRVGTFGTLREGARELANYRYLI